MSLVVTTNNGKQFEKPNSGMFHGVLADVVDLGLVTTTFQGVTKTQPMVRFVWFLDANGTDGKQLSVAARFNANLHEKSNLYKSVKQILNGAPSATFDLASLIGQTRQLFIVREKSQDGTKDFANIQGIAPAAPGKVVAVPQDFVRDENKPKDQQAKFKKKGTFGPAVTPVTPANAAVAQAVTTQGADVAF